MPIVSEYLCNLSGCTEALYPVVDQVGGQGGGGGGGGGEAGQLKVGLWYAHK